jgi:hypothetical protein
MRFFFSCSLRKNSNQESRAKNIVTEIQTVLYTRVSLDVIETDKLYFGPATASREERP